MSHVQALSGYAVEIATDPSRDIARTFSEQLTRWGGAKHLGLAGTGYARAKAGLDLLDDALTRLGERDRKSIKASLVLQRDEIARSIAAADDLIGDSEFLIGLVNASDVLQKRRLTGPKFVELVNTCDRAFADRRAADREVHLAVGDNVRAARDKIDLAGAGQRHASREIDAVAESIVYPALPDAKLFELARTNTDALLRLSATKPSARSMHAALDAGLVASPSEARLWKCFEGDEPHVLIDLRWRAFAERGE
jgi:hypothetical protein